MKPRLVKLCLISGCALLANQAHAQAPAQPVPSGVQSALRATDNAPKPPASTTKLAAVGRVDGLSAVPTPDITRATAAGSVLILVNGVVTRATLAQIQPPGAGFEYER